MVDFALLLFRLCRAKMRKDGSEIVKVWDGVLRGLLENHLLTTYSTLCHCLWALHQQGTRRCLNGRDRCLRLHTACSARLLFEAAPAKCFPSPPILPRAHLAQLASAQVGLGCNLDLHCVISSSMPSSPKALCSGVCCRDTHVSLAYLSKTKQLSGW